ncbi:VOC family protein [Prevotella sp. 10(H)]|uniref:VOC family protein n=1 Tax=Prevotella sp. 10(H) TaxID=1158294 RepID=UPI0004A7521B|nr:VOC family protein [Prevotella sp. 10(H)]
MKASIAFFEIPVLDFDRAIKFYETVLNVNLTAMDCGHDKMALFPAENGVCPGAISWAKDKRFLPSENGTMVSFNIENIERAISLIEKFGGKILISKTKIEGEESGYFSIFLDCEGNRVGLYSDK